MATAVTAQRKYTDITHVQQFHKFYRNRHVDHLYIGMARGGDLLAALAALTAGIPYTACIPWAGHRDSMPKAELALYDYLRGSAANEVILNDSEKYPGPWVYHNRNKYMVDNSNLLVALWDGTESGGAYSTVKYAESRHVPVALLL